MTIPLNRVVAFAGPYISLVAGAVVAWLIAKANVLGLPGLGEHEHELATGLAAGASLGLTALLSHLGQMKWLKGAHIELESAGAAAAAALAAPAATATLLEAQPLASGYMAGSVASFEREDFEQALRAEGLPTDEEEFGKRPGDLTPGLERAG